ncbi:MAG TPA: hydantoinase/oxoprolinase N-terminal domain-containing protein, partial [Burkholderiales bacterium]|nr:hydantoinase/oxoprolinase N-terminal domain-containing protein [Burkholderiales bacterium]
MAAKLAGDIGGTFTDVVLETSLGRYTTKVLTTSAPEAGVMDGIRRVLAEANCKPEQVSIFIHGTTLATNALIERKGARTAFVTTAGLRDILEMGYEKRFEQYDVYMERPASLVPRPLRFTVPERIDG